MGGPGAESKANELKNKPEQQEAIRLAKVTEDERLRSRVRRLQELPSVKQLVPSLKEDKEYGDLVKALEPWHGRLYNAAHTALTRRWPLEDGSSGSTSKPTVINIEFNIFQAIGGLLAVIAVIYAISQFATGGFNSQQASQSGYYGGGS